MYRTMDGNTKVPRLISRPFLLLRLVGFIVLSLLNILILSFAASNITASRTWDKFVSAGPSLAVFSSSVFLLLSMLLLGEHRYPHAIPPVSMVFAELCWVALMTVLTFVSSVLSTRLGPAQMCSLITVHYMATCSSSILVLPVSWLNFLIFFSYFITLLLVTVLHAPFVPEIWYLTVSEIPWFDLSTSAFPLEKSDLEHQTVYADAFRPAPQQTPERPPRAPWLSFPRASFTTVASFTPAWAKQHNAGLTRGLHVPFNRPLDQLSHPVQHPARAITKPTFEHGFRQSDDDPFAAPNTATTKVPDNYHYRKKQTLEPLAGFDSLLKWSTASENYSPDTIKGRRVIGTPTAQNPPHRSSKTTVTTTTVVFSPPNRGSVNSLFPHEVGEEDWNFPLKKPPFRNGRGEGWTTAGPTQDIPWRQGSRKGYI